MDIIFDRICTRLNERKKEMNIRSKDILPDNSNLSSAILHNRKDPKKNPYLIPDTQVHLIMKSLNFESSKELLFGTDEEIESYAYSLFRALIIDTIEMNDSDKSKVTKKYSKKCNYDIFNKLESVLIDYVPYAVISIYVENPVFCDFVITDKLLEIIDRGILIRDEAIERLYKNEVINQSFTNLLVKNIIKKDTIVRLDKTFLDFVIMHLLPLLIEVTSDDDMYSLGNRVYKALTNLTNEWEFLESNNFESRISISEREEYQKNVIYGLIKAEFEHTYNLLKLQENLAHY